jgi:ABC-type histidine transport system ATPase subunit
MYVKHRHGNSTLYQQQMLRCIRKSEDSHRGIIYVNNQQSRTEQMEEAWQNLPCTFGRLAKIRYEISQIQSQ